MIQLVGMQRIIVLAALLIINVMIVGAWFGVIEPRTEEATREKAVYEQKMRKMRKELSDIGGKLEAFFEHEALFTELHDTGFFGTQDRLEARKILKEMQRKSRLASIEFTVDAAEFPNNRTAQAVNYRLMRSRVAVSLKAFLDTDCYDFLRRIKEDFPGKTRITLFEIEPTKRRIRTRDIVDLSQGRNTNFVKAELEFEWYTLYSSDAAEGGDKI